MSALVRYLQLSLDSLLYGPAFGFMNHLVREPEPLNPKILWAEIMKKRNPVIEWLLQHYPPQFIRGLLLYRKMRQSHVAGISDHYDISNDYYELFLDKNYMFYSCADFRTGAETLEEAQVNKVNAMIDLIEPKPGQKILELGCGWGPMLKAIYEVTGDKKNLYGYTLSKEQLEFNNKHSGFQVELKDFITADYPENEFDCIYSIGAWEHVRPAELSRTIAKLFRAIKPGGRMVKHFFALNVDGIPISAIAGQLVFPGSQLAPYRIHFQKFQEAGFRIEWQTIHDYRPTIKVWYDRLAANQDKAVEFVGVRNYNRELAFLAATWRFFDEAESSVFRFLLRKPE